MDLNEDFFHTRVENRGQLVKRDAYSNSSSFFGIFAAAIPNWQAVISMHSSELRAVA